MSDIRLVPLLKLTEGEVEPPPAPKKKQRKLKGRQEKIKLVVENIRNQQCAESEIYNPYIDECISSVEQHTITGTKVAYNTPPVLSEGCTYSINFLAEGTRGFNTRFFRFDDYQGQEPLHDLFDKLIKRYARYNKTVIKDYPQEDFYKLIILILLDIQSITPPEAKKRILYYSDKELTDEEKGIIEQNADTETEKSLEMFAKIFIECYPNFNDEQHEPYLKNILLPPEHYFKLFEIVSHLRREEERGEERGEEREEVEVVVERVQKLLKTQVEVFTCNVSLLRAIINFTRDKEKVAFIGDSYVRTFSWQPTQRENPKMFNFLSFFVERDDMSIAQDHGMPAGLQCTNNLYIPFPGEQLNRFSKEVDSTCRKCFDVLKRIGYKKFTLVLGFVDLGMGLCYNRVNEIIKIDIKKSAPRINVGPGRSLSAPADIKLMVGGGGGANAGSTNRTEEDIYEEISNEFIETHISERIENFETFLRSNLEGIEICYVEPPRLPYTSFDEFCIGFYKYSISKLNDDRKVEFSNVTNKLKKTWFDKLIHGTVNEMFHNAMRFMLEKPSEEFKNKVFHLCIPKVEQSHKSFNSLRMPDFKDVHYDYTLLRNKYIESGIVGGVAAPAEAPAPTPAPAPEVAPEPTPAPAELEGAREGARGGAREGARRGGPAPAVAAESTPAPEEARTPEEPDATLRKLTIQLCTKFGIFKIDNNALKMFSRYTQDTNKTLKYDRSKRVIAGAYCFPNLGIETVTKYYLEEKYSWLDIIKESTTTTRGAPDLIFKLFAKDELEGIDSDYYYFVNLIIKFFTYKGNYTEVESDILLNHIGNETLFRYIKYILGLNSEDLTWLYFNKEESLIFEHNKLLANKILNFLEMMGIWYDYKHNYGLTSPDLISLNDIALIIVKEKNKKKIKHKKTYLDTFPDESVLDAQLKLVDKLKISQDLKRTVKEQLSKRGEVRPQRKTSVNKLEGVLADAAVADIELQNEHLKEEFREFKQEILTGGNKKSKRKRKRRNTLKRKKNKNKKISKRKIKKYNVNTKKKRKNAKGR